MGKHPAFDARRAVADLRPAPGVIVDTVNMIDGP